MDNKSQEFTTNTQKSEILISYSRQQLKSIDFDPTKPQMYQNNQKQQIPIETIFVSNQPSNMAFKPQQGQFFINNQSKMENVPKIQGTTFQPPTFQNVQSFQTNQQLNVNQQYPPQFLQKNNQPNQSKQLNSFNPQNQMNQYPQLNQNKNAPYFQQKF